MFKEDIMATAPAPGPIDVSHASELLEVALSILQRRHDQGLAQKLLTMQDYLEMSKTHPEWEYREGIRKALADLRGAVYFHLNTDVEAAATLWEAYITGGAH